MKTLLTFSALALVSNMAFAETFQYERQLTSEDLDPNIPSLSQGISNPAKSVQQPRVSLFDTYRGNPDTCLLYTSPSPRDGSASRMPSSA